MESVRESVVTGVPRGPEEKSRARCTRRKFKRPRESKMDFQKDSFTRRGFGFSILKLLDILEKGTYKVSALWSSRCTVLH